MFNWTTLLTSAVVSASITGVIGVLIKGSIDRRLESNKQNFEKEKLSYTASTQTQIEKLKLEISQLNALKQKNLEHFHAMSQVVQNRRIQAIEIAWHEYIDTRKYVAPIINFFSIIKQSEYFSVLNNLDDKDYLNLKSIDERSSPRGLDTTSLTENLVTQRPFLGEDAYFKIRSALMILLRLRLMYQDMVNKKENYLWIQDDLLIGHVHVIFSEDNFSRVVMPMELNNPHVLLDLINSIELELSNTLEAIISGETSANLSLERVELLNKGYRKL
nr:hypothetical protein [Mycobacterium sp. E3298]